MPALSLRFVCAVVLLLGCTWQLWPHDCLVALALQNNCFGRPEYVPVKIDHQPCVRV